MRSRVDASPDRTLALLADPAFVTPMLGDLLDQDRSSGSPPVRWILPRLHVGATQVAVELAPTWDVEADAVVIDARATERSDATVQLRLTCSAMPVEGGALLTTAWTLRMDVPLPRMLLRLARPALDRSIGHVVEEIAVRTVRGVERA